MSLFVDTGVWSLALRRNSPPSVAEVRALIRAIEIGEGILTTGLVLQEPLQGFSGPRAREQILDRFSAVPLLVPDRDDHIRAAELRNRCRRAGIRIGTIDALLAELCIRHDLTMPAADNEFGHMAGHSRLEWRRGWKPRKPKISLCIKMLPNANPFRPQNHLQRRLNFGPVAASIHTTLGGLLSERRLASHQ